MHEGIAGTINL